MATSPSHRSHKRRREAIYADGDVDISVQAVWDAYHGQCALCRELVAREDATVDHLQPLCEGGTHTWANVQLAHDRCNAKKARMEFKLRELPQVIRRRRAWARYHWLLRDYQLMVSGSEE